MNNTTPTPAPFYFYYKASEKIKSEWIDDNAITHEFENGKGKIVLAEGNCEIGYCAFSNCEKLTAITIPNSITEIGWWAFENCCQLKTILIPASVSEIGYYAFNGCSGLETIVVDDGNPVYDSRDNCNAIIETETNILIAGCQNTIIPDSIIEIRDCAFYDCTELTSIVIPDTVSTIGELAFYGCSKLTSIVMPKDAEYIGDGAFEKTGWYNNSPNGILYLDGWCLGFKSNETKGLRELDWKRRWQILRIGFKEPIGCLNIAEGTIGISDFAHCKGLTSINIPHTVKTINNRTFVNCSNLASIVIPNSVSKIGWGIFNFCKGLETIVVEDGNAVYDSRDNCNAIIETKTNTLIAGCKSTIIPNSVKVIANYAFCGSSDLTSIVIPDSVTKIGLSAFADCKNLTSIVIPESVVEIGDNAFQNCKNLPEEIKEQIKNINPESYGEFDVESWTNIDEFRNGNCDVPF